MAAFTIGLDNKYRSYTTPPEQYISELDKTAEWYYANLNWISSFYNQPEGMIDFSSANTSNSGNTSQGTRKIYPVQFMLKMISYYLGDQPNMNFNHLVPNITSTNLQPNWIKGQDVSEFVNYFRGLIMEKVANLSWNGKPMSKNAISKRDEKYNALMLMFDMKPIFQRMAEGGIKFNPEGASELEMPEDAKKWMDTNYKEYGAIVATNLANGLWFSNDWAHKCLQSFMYCVITSHCAMEHYVSNGRTQNRILMPYQLIIDNRYDDDYGKRDQFIGVVESMTPAEIFSDSRFDLSEEQKKDIQEMARSGQGSRQYNTSSNILWWSNTGATNMVTVVTTYFRGLRDTGKQKTKSIVGNEYIKENNYGDKNNYMFQDIYKATLIGNKYLTNYGLIDNLVENQIDKAVPCFPIIRFRPNTFMGTSKSEVARIYMIQDEMDMLDFKIRDMVGKAIGKVYIVTDKFAQSLPKEFMEDAKTIGIHFAQTASEFKDESARQRGVELIDWSLDPNIGQLANLYRERKDRMGKILSSSEISRGQQTKYIGLGVMQGAINQNSFGVAYLLDGFLDWMVLNMRYEVNQAKMLYASKKKSQVQFLIGDRGMAYLDFTKDDMFEDFWITLTINNLLNEKKRERILAIAQADSQNGKLGTNDYIELEDATSTTELREMFEYKSKKSQKEVQKNQVINMQFEQQLAERDKWWKTEMVKLQEDSANFRTIYSADMTAITKGITDLLKSLPPQPPASELNKPPQPPQAQASSPVQ